jgi:putative flippase GtrA
MAQRLLISRVVKNPREMLVAGVGGIAATVSDAVALLLLVKVAHASIPLSAFLAASVGAVVCFVWNKYIAFRDGTPISFEQLVRFGGVALTTAILTAGGMKLVAVEWHVPVLLAKALCAAAIFIAWTFPAQRRFVFKKPAVTAVA